MTIGDIKRLLDATVLGECCELDKEVKAACGSDMMSDVLAFVKDQAVLLTGLINPQVIRTAQMMDMVCIVFVRGKVPSEQMTQLADESGITLLSTHFRMFKACGVLFENGLHGGSDVE